MTYLLEKLKNTMEGEKNMLDKSMIIYGSPMGDSNIHNHKKCPLFIAGHANGHLAGNIHHRAEHGTPMANVFLTLMQMLGFEDMESREQSYRAQSSDPLELGIHDRLLRLRFFREITAVSYYLSGYQTAR